MTTTINKEYALRFLGVALLFLVFAGWFLYDGMLGYPQKNAQLQPIAAQLAERPLTPADWMNQVKTGTAPLVEAFRAAGMDAPAKICDTYSSWINTQDPRAQSVEAARAVLLQPLYSENDILAQFISAGIGLAASLLLMACVLLRVLTRHTLENDTLTVTFGKRSTVYPLTTLQQVDDTQWEKRGILKARFGSRWLTLDAWHHAGVRPIAEVLIQHEAPAK